MNYSTLRTRSGRLALIALALTASLSSWSVYALPSYARQTGESCGACHIGGFGPQLTPHGIKFKIGGYTDSDGQAGHIPLSAMLVANSATLGKGSTDFIDEFGARSNNNISLQEFSVFLAGRLAPGIGSFAQATYSGIEHKTSLDNVDIRYAKELDIRGSGATVGLSLNNNPGVQDPFNTLPAWRYPYTSPDLAISPSQAPLLDGTLSQAVMGANAYLMLDSGLYVEAGAYTNSNRRVLKNLGVVPDTILDQTAPYARIAYFKDLRNKAFSLGLVGMQGRVRDRTGSAGVYDLQTDVGVDASYQFLGNRKHIFTVDSSLIREHQTRFASYDSGAGADNLKGDLSQFNLASSYYYHQKYGVTGRVFNIIGSNDQTLYSSDEYSHGSPNSKGYTLQADWTPLSSSDRFGTLLNVRVGMQYTGYTQFNGANRDELIGTSDRKPGDNNVFSVFFWGAY
jgi:hypothetical protein